VDGITCQSQRIRNHQCPLAADAIGERSAWILINGVQQIFKCTEQSDHQRGCAEFLHVSRQETVPQLLAAFEQKKRQRDDQDIAKAAHGVMLSFSAWPTV